MASATTVQTALCVIPPENVWQQIQAIRSTSDKAYPRWMPHINLIYPFVPEGAFENIKAQLESVVHRQKPFLIHFDQSSFHHFQQSGDGCTYHLRPKDTSDVLALQACIQNQLSNVCKKKRAFEAHLTLGQSKAGNIDGVFAALKANWTPIEFMVDRVYMISRENHPDNLFTIKNEIHLLDQKDDAPASASSSSAAVNYLCIVPSNGFSSRLLRVLDQTSFQPLTPLRIILAEYDDGPVDKDLRTKLESTVKFALQFDQDSIGHDEATSTLFLRPTNIEPISQLNVLDGRKHDGSLTLGRLDRKDFDGVRDRFTKDWANGMSEFGVDRIHLMAVDGRVKFIFRLKN